jgi:hypothetical protein
MKNFRPMPTCIECGTYDVEQESRLGLCDYCFTESYATCSRCDKNVNKDSVFDELCEDCQALAFQQSDFIKYF